MKNSQNIVFFGNEQLATGLPATDLPIVTSLLSAGYRVKTIILTANKPSRRPSNAERIRQLAKTHEIPVLEPTRVIEIVDQLRGVRAEAAVLAAYGQILPREIIELFPRGIINIHPSLLPGYRGSTPIEQAILDSAEQTGVCLMQIVEEMDAGPVFAQRTFAIPRAINKIELADALAKLGSEMLVEHLPQILSGAIQPKAQDNSAATYTARIKKADGVIDWTKPAVRLEREIRAYLGWPGSQTELNGRPVLITKASVSEDKGTSGEITIRDRQLIAFCGTGALVIERLKPAGKPEMTATAYLAGHPLG